MIAAYKVDRLLAELNGIQRYMEWGMICKGQLFKDVYREEMTTDCDPLRSIDEILNSKYASCLEYAIVMKHVSDRLGIPGKQCVIPRDVSWAMHGVLVVGAHIVSMGYSVRVAEVKNVRNPLIEIRIKPGDTRQRIHSMMCVGKA